MSIFFGLLALICCCITVSHAYANPYGLGAYGAGTYSSASTSAPLTNDSIVSHSEPASSREESNYFASLTATTLKYLQEVFQEKILPMFNPQSLAAADI